MILELLQQGVIGDTLDANIANTFHSDAAAERLSKRLLTSITIIAPTVTFVRGKTDTAMEDKTYNTSFLTKDWIDTVEMCNIIDDSNLI